MSHVRADDPVEQDGHRELTAEKYVVRHLIDGTSDEQLAPGTYFVLRDSDMFTSAVLWSYVQIIQTVLEVDTQRRLLADSERAQLRAIEDHVQNLAEQWQRSGKGRLPT